MKKRKRQDNGLVEGMAYTIHLLDFTRIKNAIYHHCTASGQHYFAKGKKVYGIEQVFRHSMCGHTVTAATKSISEPSSPDRLAITDDVDEMVDVITTPQINPDTFRRRVKCLMMSDMTQAEAEKYAVDNPMQLSLFYDIGRGGFAVDAVFVDQAEPYNPFTGEEIPNETV